MIRFLCIFSLFVNSCVAFGEDGASSNSWPSTSSPQRVSSSTGEDDSSGSSDEDDATPNACRSLSPKRRPAVLTTEASSPMPSSAKDISLNHSDMFWNHYACLVIGGTVFAGLVWVFK